jgi:hypothetical protein
MTAADPQVVVRLPELEQGGAEALLVLQICFSAFTLSSSPIIASCFIILNFCHPLTRVLLTVGFPGSNKDLSLLPSVHCRNAKAGARQRVYVKSSFVSVIVRVYVQQHRQILGFFKVPGFSIFGGASDV